MIRKGSRVKFIGETDENNHAVGELGTVIGVGQDTCFKTYAIEWDETDFDEGLAYYYEHELEEVAEEEAKVNDIVRVSQSAHGTCDIVVYATDIAMVDFFRHFDVWGANGYDRFHDGGIYFEVPSFMYDLIEEIPYIRRSHIKIEKL